MLDIETIVYSRIKSILTSKLKTKYQDISFTTSDKVIGKPRFPNVYVHMIDSSEIGQDLEGKTINGVSASFQIEVSDNENQFTTKEVMKDVVSVMKDMRFSATLMPIFSNVDNAYRCIARFERTIGALDKI